MRIAKNRFEWPTRHPFYDEQGRLTAEHHIANGRVIARLTFDPETKLKTSYTSGGVTLFYQNGILIRKEVRNDGGNLSSVESYSNQSGLLHSATEEPAHTKYSDDGKVVYMAWYNEGKKDRPSKLDRRNEALIPQPSVVKELSDGIVEKAYYRNDELNNPSRNFAAIQYLKGDATVLECHFHNNQIHNADGPAILSTHDKARLVGHALNGRMTAAEFTEPFHTCTYTFNEKGEVIAENEEFDLSYLQKDDPALANSFVENMMDSVADDRRTELTTAFTDPTDPRHKRRPPSTPSDAKEQ